MILLEKNCVCRGAGVWLAHCLVEKSGLAAGGVISALQIERKFMSERIFRIILGVTLLAILYFDIPNAIYFYLAVLIFEGITNWRVPALVSRQRYGALRR